MNRILKWIFGFSVLVVGMWMMFYAVGLPKSLWDSIVFIIGLTVATLGVDLI